jgi:hypothetical protein
MSATRDKTQKITFVYSNLYSIYRKGVEQARESAPLGLTPGLTRGAVIKAAAESAAPAAQPAAPRVSAYTPAELIGKRVAKPASVSPVESLKQNLQQLNDLQARLRFMLKELEDLVKE